MRHSKIAEDAAFSAIFGGLVTNENDEVLFVKSERRGWKFPGGQVESGESLPQAWIREIWEESGDRLLAALFNKVI